MTSDIERRLLEHNKGLSKSTKPYIPWTLVYKEEFKTSDAARAREKFLKTAAGRRWRKENINKGH